MGAWSGVGGKRSVIGCPVSVRGPGCGSWGCRVAAGGSASGGIVPSVQERVQGGGIGEGLEGELDDWS